MKSMLLVAVLLGGMDRLLSAQVAPQPAEPVSPSSVERVRAALMSSPPSLVIPSVPDERRLGVLTFVPPDAPGEFVRVRVPIGAFAVQAAHAVAAAHHRRQERAAREEVARELAAFLSAPKP